MDDMKELVELIQGAQGGSWDSLCALVEKLCHRIQSLADYYAMRCHEDAEDLVQEAWLGALEALKEVDINIGNPQQFLIRRAKWKMLNFINWNRRRQHESLEKLEASDSADHPTLQEQLEQAEQVEQTVASVHINQFVNQLNGKQKELVGLLLAGNTWREAASMLGCSSANVAYHVRQIQKEYLHWASNGNSSNGRRHCPSSKEGQ